MSDYVHRTKTHRIRPFDFILNIHVSNDVGRTYKEVLPNSKVGISAISYACTHTDSSSQYVNVFFPEDCTAGAVSHEALHVVDFVMDAVGAEYEEEIWAYHIQDIVDECFEFIYEKVLDKKPEV